VAKVIPIGTPVNEAERRTIAHLRDAFPDAYTVVHNFEIRRDHQVYEIDIALIAPHAVYIIDAKGTRGAIEVQGNMWYPSGRRPFRSPLPKLREHAKAIKGLITAANPANRDLERIYVVEAVILCAPDAYLIDSRDRDIDRVCTIKRSKAHFNNTGDFPSWASTDIRAFQNLVIRTITDNARSRSGPLRFGNWEVSERIGSCELYTEYRAFNSTTGHRSGTVNLRVYQADPYAEEDLRQKQKARIQNAYEALAKLPPHPNIVGVRDFFPNEHEDRYMLVSDDTPGRALRLHISQPSLALTLDQKWRVAEEILTGLAHAHAHGVVHRNLIPAAVMLCTDGVTRLADFDYSRSAQDRSHTIAEEITESLSPQYLAPECYQDAAAASAASDVFSAGVVLYELFTGVCPFESPTEVFDLEAKFKVPPSRYVDGLPKGFDDWLQTLCGFNAANRPSAREALTGLQKLQSVDAPAAASGDVPRDDSPAEVNYENLPVNFELAGKYVIQEKIGKGSYGTVYRAFDVFADVHRAVKVTTKDRHSVLERFKKEYRNLVKLPPHPNVVQVIDGNIIPGVKYPYLAFEWVDGDSLEDFIKGGVMTAQDCVVFAIQAGEGLAHCHAHGVFHCDIKPANLLWTPTGAKVIDFNVSVRAEDSGHGGGCHRYLPPDLDLSQSPGNDVREDRDCYALALSLYEAITSHYPWNSEKSLPQLPPDPRGFDGCAELSKDLIDVLNHALGPKREQRYPHVLDFVTALKKAGNVRVAHSGPDTGSDSGPGGKPVSSESGELITGGPYVDYLCTLYSQSSRSNCGTRGMDALGDYTYARTALDDELLPAVLRGDYGLVIISGNAGDGKTAFLQQLERAALAQKAKLKRKNNGCVFTLKKHRFVCNYDGSQDEGDVENDQVLLDFFASYRGEQIVGNNKETRLIAINEGRLVDFLHSHRDFSGLAAIVERGLKQGAAENGVVVVNLNLRSVVAPGKNGKLSIFDRVLERMSDRRFWQGCDACELKDECYALHNARTFYDAKVGPIIRNRLRHLYLLTHLRGHQHITLRDLRSALAFMLTSNRTCDEIKALYKKGDTSAIVDGFYFNSWKGGSKHTADRLLSLLADMDMGYGTDPSLDRALDFQGLKDGQRLLSLQDRGTFDRDVFETLYTKLPHGIGEVEPRERIRSHRRYVRLARRLYYFERRDNGWRNMLPYVSGDCLSQLVSHPDDVELLSAALERILVGINRGEGLPGGSCLSGGVGLQVRQVSKGTIRNYRLFPRRCFCLTVPKSAEIPFIEGQPDSISLEFSGDGNLKVELCIHLDLFEMFERLCEGYAPSIEDRQGSHLNLAAFRNALSAAPYQEILLSRTGRRFFRVSREENGRLTLTETGEEKNETR
jgi:serine/threonine protein kinase